jgi:hypothetical protein
MTRRDPEKRVLCLAVGTIEGEHRPVAELPDDKVVVVQSHGLTREEAELVALGVQEGLQRVASEEIEAVSMRELVVEVVVPGFNAYQNELVARGVRSGVDLAGQGYWLEEAPETRDAAGASLH